jgi:hypothetical protein
VKFIGMGFEDLACFMWLKGGDMWWAVVYTVMKILFLYFYSCGASTVFRVMSSLYGASRSHSDTPHSVGLLWTGDQPVAETCTWQHPQDTNILANVGIRTHNPRRQATPDPRFGPHCTLFPYGGENLVTSREPAGFPYRLCFMLLANNGQGLGFL